VCRPGGGTYLRIDRHSTQVNARRPHRRTGTPSPTWVVRSVEAS
jgi:hypothetical protein